jgi:hypothetical protein
MKNSVLWDVAPCGSCKNRRFGGTCRLSLQSRLSVSKRKTLEFVRGFFSTLKMEATSSFETLVFRRPTRCHIPQDGILQTKGEPLININNRKLL